jgi:glycopeptide antibiotics resistance protein
LGVYVQIFKKDWKKTTKCLVIFGCGFLFEVVQFIFAIGASDITDLMMNTFGGIIGIIFCIIMRKIAPKKFISIINISGMLIEFTGIGLMILLLAANR